MHKWNCRQQGFFVQDKVITRMETINVTAEMMYIVNPPPTMPGTLGKYNPSSLIDQSTYCCSFIARLTFIMPVNNDRVIDTAHTNSPTN